jgi:hypothetical protein
VVLDPEELEAEIATWNVSHNPPSEHTRDLFDAKDPEAVKANEEKKGSQKAGGSCETEGCYKEQTKEARENESEAVGWQKNAAEKKPKSPPPPSWIRRLLPPPWSHPGIFMGRKMD